MDEKANDLNPFAHAKTLEERDRVWKSFKNMAQRISNEEGERLIEQAIRLHLAEKK